MKTMVNNNNGCIKLLFIAPTKVLLVDPLGQCTYFKGANRIWSLVFIAMHCVFILEHILFPLAATTMLRY